MNRNLMTLLLAMFLCTLTGCWTFDKEWRGGSVRPYDDSGDDDDTAASDDDDSVGDDDDSVGDDDDDDDASPDPEPCQDEEFLGLDGSAYTACSYPVVERLSGSTSVSSTADGFDMIVEFGVEGPQVTLAGFMVTLEAPGAPGYFLENNIEGVATNLGGDANEEEGGCWNNTCEWFFVNQALVQYAVQEMGEDADELQEFFEDFLGIYTSNIVIYQGDSWEVEMEVMLDGNVPTSHDITWKVGDMIVSDGAGFYPDRLYMVNSYDDDVAELTGIDQTRTVQVTGGSDDIEGCDLSVYYQTEDEQYYDIIQLIVGSWSFTDANGNPYEEYRDAVVEIVYDENEIEAGENDHVYLEAVLSGGVVSLEAVMANGSNTDWSCEGTTAYGQFVAICNEGTTDEVDITDEIYVYDWGPSCNMQVAIP